MLKFNPRHSYFWKRHKRVEILERDKYRCVRCGSTRNLQIDHVKRIFDGGSPFDVNNLQTLCCDCHNRKTAQENRKYACKGSEDWYNYRETAKMR